MKAKTCKHCGVRKTLEMFHPNGQGTPNSRCKACHNAYERRRRQTPEWRARRRQADRTRYLVDPVFAERARESAHVTYWRNKLGEAESA